MLGLFSKKETPKQTTTLTPLRENEEYIAVQTRIYTAGRGQAFVHDQEKGRVYLVSSFEASLLPSLSHFRTARDHLSGLIKERGRIASKKTIEVAFRQLHTLGFIRSRSQLFPESRKISSQPNQSISTIVWPSLDRMELLERCLESYVAHNRRFERNVRYLVLNNSFSIKNSKLYRDALASMAAREDLPIYFTGIEELKGFIKEMVKAGKGDGLPQRTLEFAILGEKENSQRYGVVRNAALLATAGEMFLTTDDDTSCRFAESPEFKTGIELSSVFDPSKIRFYANRQAVLYDARFKEVNILAEHESLLGRSMIDCLSSKESGQGVATSRMSPDYARLVSEGKGRVALTATGVCGDSAMGSAKIVLKLEGETRELAMGTKELYDSSTTSKEIIRGVKRKTISDGTFLMAGNVAIDNRQLLPPFFTIGRNEEGIFALILRSCYEEALIGYLPLSVYHDPPNPSRMAPEQMCHFGPRVGEVLILLIESFRDSIGSEAPTERLQDLARNLTELSGLPLPEFVGYVRYRWMVRLGSYLHFLDELLERHQFSPEYWARDIVALKEAVKAFLASGRIAVLDATGEKNPKEAEAKQVQLTIGQFGELLYWWPCIVNLSRELNEEGKGLAVRV